MGVDLFGIGKSALLSFQNALSTTGHNIANVNTEGFSRQQVVFGTSQPFFAGRGYLGTGVEPTEVRRIYNQFISQQVTHNTALSNFQNSLQQLTGTLDTLAGSDATSLNTPMQFFFNATQEVATSTSDIAAREVLLGESRSLVERFHLMNSEFDRLEHQVNSEIRTTVDDINALSDALAKINEDIVEAYAQGSAPNDLLDQRDLMINTLAENVSVQTFEEDNGSMSVFIGSGQALVVGVSANNLTAGDFGVDPNQLEIAIDSPSGPILITSQITGGRLAAQLDFRDNDLNAARNEIGRVAIGLATEFNAQHAQGLDLDGDLGGDYFTIPSPEVLDDPNNSTFGVSSISLQFEDVGQLTTDDYRLSYDGANWVMTNLSSSQNVPLTPSGGDFLADGLRITPDPGAVAGDSYILRPTRQGSAEIDLLIDDPRNIAAASTHDTSTLQANTGTGQITDVEVSNPLDPNFSNDINIVFNNPPTTYSVDAGPAQPYTAGSDITVNGLTFQISGTPAAGDTFNITYNSNAVGNGANALKLADIQQKQFLEGGNETVFSAYDEYLARVGTRTRQVNFNADSQAALLAQSIAQQQGVSGVNLDEEAANLQKYQQSYQAAAQVISVADNVFNTLLQAVRG